MLGIFCSGIIELRPDECSGEFSKFLCMIVKWMIPGCISNLSPSTNETSLWVAEILIHRNWGVPSIQGQEIPMADQVNIMTLAPMLPARVSNATNHHLMFLAQTDTFIEIPILRWDNAVYYTDFPDNYSGHPRSYTKLGVQLRHW